MDAVFDQRELLSRETLRELQTRSDAQSYWRLTLHLGAIVLLGYLVSFSAALPVVAAIFTIALAFAWAAVFAPFHECIHRTAFKSRTANAIGAWLTGIPFAMAPAVYRAFHFEHHRHTQDPDRDPELLGFPDGYSSWPTTWLGWLMMGSGYGLLVLKGTPLLRFSTAPTDAWDRIAWWTPPPEDRRRMAWENRIVLGLWVIFLVTAAIIIDGGWWLIAAAWLAQIIEALWVAAEHTGLPQTGSILERTRTVQSSPFVRWWIWNMNYHAEHHAWPGIPWYRLPATHEKIENKLDHNVVSYLNLYRRICSGDEPSNRGPE